MAIMKRMKHPNVVGIYVAYLCLYPLSLQQR